MPFAEREPFVHSGVQSDDLAWNKGGTSFGTKLWQRSHVVGWRSTSSNTRRRLRRHESGECAFLFASLECQNAQWGFIAKREGEGCRFLHLDDAHSSLV